MSDIHSQVSQRQRKWEVACSPPWEVTALGNYCMKFKYTVKYIRLVPPDHLKEETKEVQASAMTEQ